MNIRLLHSGFGLLEVLIAAAILAFVLLGILHMIIYSLHGVQKNYYRSLAQVRLQSMGDILLANQNNVERNKDFVEWLAWNQKFFPQSEGGYVCDDVTCQIKLTWRYRDHIQELKLRVYSRK